MPVFKPYKRSTIQNPYKRNPLPSTKVQHSLFLLPTLYVFSVKKLTHILFYHWLNHQRSLYRIPSGISFDSLSVITGLSTLNWNVTGSTNFWHHQNEYSKRKKKIVFNSHVLTANLINSILAKEEKKEKTHGLSSFCSLDAPILKKKSGSICTHFDIHYSITR